MAKKSVAVHIGAQRHVVKSEADATYVRNLASYVDEHINEIQSSSRAIPAQKLAVLAALNIADDLFQEKKRNNELCCKIRDKAKALLSYLEKEEKNYIQEED